MKKKKIIYLSPEEARVIIPGEMEDQVRKVIAAIQNSEDVSSMEPIGVSVPFEDGVSMYVGIDPNGRDIVYASLSVGNSEFDWAHSDDPEDFFDSWGLSYMGYAYRMEIVSEREALSEALFNNGHDAISDFVGYDYNPDEDKDTVQNRIDEAYAQMPEEELDMFLAKYVFPAEETPAEEDDDTDPETDLDLALEAFNHDVIHALNVPDFGMEISKAYGIPDDEIWIYWEWSRLGKSDVKKFKLPQKKITAETVDQVRAWMYQMIIVIINQR